MTKNLPASWRQISPKDLKENPLKLIGSDWMLITAGNAEGWNTMTASWGGVGVLWNHDVAFSFIRPGRYTYGFMEKSERFSLSFFPADKKDALQFCGSHSGRDTDKAAGAGISPVLLPGEGAVTFAEASLVLECKKLYAQDFDPACFVDPGLATHYPKQDYHRLFIGSIEGAWISA